MAFPLQQLEGKYEILEKIAEGGMGAVYKVRHRLLEEVRVIKVMRPQLEQQEENKSRFLREAKIAVRMRHPNIAQMYDFSIDDSGNSFIVMEYIDGVTLQDLLKRSGPPGVALCLEIAQQSLQALGYLHRKGIVHRDISPDNLMLSQDEVGEPAVKLIDLGIAKPSHGEANLTATGLFLGKIKYASPEHFKASEGIPVDQRSDLYCFGLVLYEVLTGVHPVAGSNWSELIAGHLFEKPRDFAATDPEGRLPEELRQVVLTSLAKAADERYQDAKTFRRAILQLQTDFPLAQEEFAQFLRQREQDRAAREGARAGTTQERLDAQFKAGRGTPAATSTPGALDQGMFVESGATVHRDATPTPDQTRQVAPATPSARTQERVRELVEGARRLADLNLFDEAGLQARAAQQLDSSNPDVAALLEAIDTGQRRAQLIESRIEAIERLIAQESFNDALAHVIDAVAELGEAEELQELRGRIEQLAAQHRFSRAAALVKEAHALADAQAFTDAVARLEQAEDLDPGNTVVRNHLAEVREAMRAHEQAQRQATLVTESAAAIEALIAAGDYHQARGRLGEALERCGREPILVGLGDRIAALEEKARADRVTGLLAEAAAATAGGDHRAAVSLLEEAVGVDPDSSEVAGRLREARETLRAAEQEQRRAAEVAELGSEVEALIATDRLADARARLEHALDRLGPHPPLLTLQDRVSDLERRKRERTISGLLEQAESHSNAGEHDAAIAAIERALELDPDHATASSRLADAQAARAEADRRRRDDETRGVSPEAAADAVSVPPVDRTMAIPTAAAKAAVELAAGPDRTTALPLGEVAQPSPPTDGTVALPMETPVAPRAPKPKPEPKPEPKPKRAAPSVTPQATVAQAPAAPLVTPKVEKPAPAAVPARPKRAPWVLIGGAAALVAIVAAVIALWPGGGPPVGNDTGTVVINAVPWGQVESIVDADDEAQGLGASSYTPMTVTLPPGRYRISLRNPARPDPLVVEAEVKAGETSRAPLADFGGVEVSTVLEKYGL